MNSPNFEIIEEQFLLIFKCLPMSFGERLPAKLRLRYLKLLSEIIDFPKRITKFQALQAGEKYQKPDWFRRSTQAPKNTSADFHKLNDAFISIQQSLPYKYMESLSHEEKMSYLRILKQHANLQEKSQRLGKALQKNGFL